MKKILVIRETDEFSRILAKNNFEIINLPLIKTEALNNLGDFERKLETLENYDGVFLTSKQAAEIFRAKLLEKKISCRRKVYVLGRRSFEILKDENLDLIFFESAHTAREMLEKIPAKDLADKKFLFVRGDKSLRVVPEFLKNFSEVDEAVVYETRTIKTGIDEINLLRGAVKNGKILAACFFSPSAAQNFIKQFGAEVLHQTRIAAIGKTTADFFERQNLSVNFISSKSNIESFAVELIEYLRKEI